MGKRSLSEVFPLFRMQTYASQTKLRTIKAREDKLHALFAKLADNKSVLSDGTDPKYDSTRDFQNDLLHLRWADQRRAVVNAELAQVRALVDMARIDLKHHFTRQKALERLLESQIASQKKALDQKNAYGS